MLDVGAVAARSGPPVAAADEASAPDPGDRRTRRRTGRAGERRHVLARGRRGGARRRARSAINDIGGGAGRDARAGRRARAAATCSCTSRGRRGSTGRRRATTTSSTTSAVVRGAARAGASRSASPPEQIALDPGLDFDLTIDDDVEILHRLGELRALGRPLSSRSRARTSSGRSSPAPGTSGCRPRERGTARWPRRRWPSPTAPRCSASTTSRPSTRSAWRPGSRRRRRPMASAAEATDLPWARRREAGGPRSTPAEPTAGSSPRAPSASRRPSAVPLPVSFTPTWRGPRARRDHDPLRAPARGAAGGETRRT